ncbi:hypothetical protein OG563_00015 [Nocardia vinacea]|uniref:ATP-dependent DNA ligase family profile domain-containing protein n=1 Tax=Nocardia vinacea TaxID=96468 RepID=A0ABZ1YTT3_9NOCA|nr:hypothetical protein [Nocardia vinacea]
MSPTQRHTTDPKPPTNVTASYPELAAAVEELTGRTDLILDGEIIAPDPINGMSMPTES